MKTIVLCTTLLVMLAGCKSNPSTPMSASVSNIVEDAHSKVKVGMTQAQVLRIMGEPQHKRNMVKDGSPGFGFPSWWYTELKNGDKVEAWDYKTPNGKDTVYFINGSTNVKHTRFIGKGIVF
jgi:outer membrane protein assembly factor BamE (lipoprotein component of BamABCDE complex)